MIGIGPQVTGDRRTGVRVKIGPVSAMIESDLSRRESSREAVGAESGGCVEVINFERCSMFVPVCEHDGGGFRGAKLAT